MSTVLPSAAEKPRFVNAMFGRIAARYDVMNTVMTLGLDAGWRAAVVDAAGVSPGGTVLDIGAGTGKLAEEIAARVPQATVVAGDFSFPMMLAGLAHRHAQVRFTAADALCLPFQNGSFQAVVSGFLVRNLNNLELGIEEQVRVLRPGGRLVILEITPGPVGLLAVPFRLYFRWLVPLIGSLIARDSAAYTYLPQSAAAFVPPERLADRLRSAGFQRVSVRHLAFGSVAVTAGSAPGYT